MSVKGIGKVGDFGDQNKMSVKSIGAKKEEPMHVKPHLAQ